MMPVSDFPEQGGFIDAVLTREQIQALNAAACLEFVYGGAADPHIRALLKSVGL
jgi:hypothetical protein